MTHEERVIRICNAVYSILNIKWEPVASLDVRETLLLELAAVEREALERAAAWHDEQERRWRTLTGKDGIDRETKLQVLGAASEHKSYATAIRGLKDEDA